MQSILEGTLGSNWTEVRSELVQRYGVSTVQDLAELTKADLSQLATEDQWDRLHTAVLSFQADALKKRQGQRTAREHALREVAASAARAAPTEQLNKYFVASGTHFWAPRFAALGVEVARDLLELHEADLKELGLTVVQKRRALGVFALVANSSTRVMVADEQVNTSMPAAAFLGRLRIPAPPLEQDLAAQRSAETAALELARKLGVSTAADLCTLRAKGVLTRTLASAGVRLLQRRRVFAALDALGQVHATANRHLSSSVHDASSSLHDASDPLVAKLSSSPPATTERSQRSRRHGSGSKGVIDFTGCRHLFLDVGANIGLNVRHLWHPSKYRWGAMQPLFDRLIGHTSRARRQPTVCAVAFEANPHHTAPLRRLQREMRMEQGLHANVVVPTAVATQDGETTFFLDDTNKVAKDVRHEWSASMLRHDGLKVGPEGWARNVTVPTIDLARFIRDRVITRKLSEEQAAPRTAPGDRDPNSEPDGPLPPSLIMKMDIEGAEFGVLSRMLTLGILCQLSAIAIEFHDERRKGFIPIARAAKVPSNFAAVLEFIRAHAGPECGVNIVQMSAEGT